MKFLIIISIILQTVLSCRPLWDNQCVNNGDCCSQFCDRPGHWATGVCKENPAGNVNNNQISHGENGECSWYGVGLDGALTASGEKYNGNDMTAAHKTLAFGTRVKVSCDGRSVVVRINDRGPFYPGRILDVSRAGAAALGITDKGVCNCNVEGV